MVLTLVLGVYSVAAGRFSQFASANMALMLCGTQYQICLKLVMTAVLTLPAYGKCMVIFTIMKYNQHAAVCVYKRAILCA